MRKRAIRITTEEIPADIATPVFRLADRRCEDFIRHWTARQFLEPPMSLAELTRSIYLQGMYDGYTVYERRAMKPSIGRIVIYNHPGSADGKYPPTQSPAIIQNVAADGTVRLFVFGPKGQHMDDGLTQGDGPCQWNWPVRVE